MNQFASGIQHGGICTRAETSTSSMNVTLQIQRDRLKASAARIPGVSFRQELDELAENAAFFAFFLPSKEKAQAVNEILKSEGCEAICFTKDSRYYFSRWQYLFEGRTAGAPGQLSTNRHKEGAAYDPAALPKSSAIMTRLLVFQLPFTLAEEQLARMCVALEKAATAV